jgi:hypothetical protein
MVVVGGTNRADVLDPSDTRFVHAQPREPCFTQSQTHRARRGPRATPFRIAAPARASPLCLL